MDRILVTVGGVIGSQLVRDLYLKRHFVRRADIKWDDYIEEHGGKTEAVKSHARS